MASIFDRIVLRPITWIVSDKRVEAMIEKRARELKKQLTEEVTDDFLELLLKAMDVSFFLSSDYRRNIEGFKGGYLFKTSTGGVAAGAVFKNGNMKVRKKGIDDWDIKVEFTDADALNTFLFSKNQDILNSLLDNTVEVEGNVNFIFKFGFMAKDLGHRLGVV